MKLQKDRRIALAGNPNSGKTTLFNVLTGSRQHVGNWPGVTVEKKQGIYKQDKSLHIIDLPGTYSLSPYSDEERIANDYLNIEKPEVVINIVDATNIERNLYLSLQIINTGVPVVIALNMMDEISERGDKIDCEKLSTVLGVPVVPIIARNKKGIQELMEVVIEKLQNLETLGSKKIYDDNITKKLGMSNNDDKEDIEVKTADLMYQFIEKVVKETVTKNKVDKSVTKSDKIDKILTNRILAIPIFLLIMYTMFSSVFSENFLWIKGLPSPGVWLAGWVEAGWGALTGLVESVLEIAGASPWVFSLVIDAVFGGVGAVLGFLPLVLILFILMSVLEDSGYMARVAFVMDRIFRKFGLSGKSFIPLLMGFGCSVPALMATRTLDSEKDRKITMIITPFMSCSAKLPIYAMFVGTLFVGLNNTLIVLSIYLLGVFVAIISALILSKLIYKGQVSNFIMELPRYRIPTLTSIAIHAWEKIKSFVIKAGTVIFVSTVIIWLLSNFNFNGMTGMENSFLASIGKAISFIFTPLGFGNWQASVGVVTGWIAKENVVATFEVILPDVTNSFNNVTAYSYMAFNLLCMPCFAAVGAMKREMGAWKWTLLAVGFQMSIAYIVALLINIVGGLIW